VLTLRELKGLSYPDIARRLGLPEGTVKSALNRGRQNLMREMARLDCEANGGAPG
jgi:RNA polymerase sigma-70 factor (ECF subfamily)